MQTEAKLLKAEASSRKRLRAAAALLLLAPSRYKRDDLAETILVARLESTRAGVAAADVQLAKIELTAARPAIITASITDYARAGADANSFTRWLASSAEQRAAMTRAEAAASVQARIDRIAATQSSESFNFGLNAEARRIGRTNDVVLYRTWTAYADACPACWDNHGETVRLDQPYASGEEPGFVHPQCRCSEDFST